jgi:hypothetical protein
VYKTSLTEKNIAAAKPLGLIGPIQMYILASREIPYTGADRGAKLTAVSTSGSGIYRGTILVYYYTVHIRSGFKQFSIFYSCLYIKKFS